MNIPDSQYWPTSLEYDKCVGDNEKPVRGMYNFITSFPLPLENGVPDELRSKTAIFPKSMEDFERAFYCESDDDLNLELINVKKDLIRLKNHSACTYSVLSIKWSEGDRRALLIGPVDGPLGEGRDGWPEQRAIQDLIYKKHKIILEQGRMTDACWLARELTEAELVQDLQDRAALES